VWTIRIKPKAALDRQRSDYKETDGLRRSKWHIVPGVGACVISARRRGDQHNYGYCGTEPNTNATFLIFGVAEVGKAVKILEQAAAAAATT